MAKQILLNSRVFANGADLTSVSTKAVMEGSVEEKDATNFGSQGYKEIVPGLVSASFDLEGWWETGSLDKVDNNNFAYLGLIGPWTVCPVAASTVGDIAYFSKVLQTDFVVGGAVGEIAPYKAHGEGNWPLVRGVVANLPGTARTSSGTSTGVNLGAVASLRYIYAAIHVLSVAGTSTPTITARIESDDNSGFTSATTRATFTAATAIGGETLRALGPFTDTWWRAAWTISGSSPSFLAMISMGISI